MTGSPANGPPKIDEIDKVSSEACTRSGAFALLVSVLLLVLCISLQGRKADQALADYVSGRQNLAMFLDELQKDKTWQKYIESHPDGEQKPLAEVIQAHVPITVTAAASKTETRKPDDVPHGANPKPQTPNSTLLVPAAPTGVTATAVVDQYEMSHVVKYWRALNDSDLLSRSRESSNYFDFSIVKWANRRNTILYSNILNGFCQAKELEVPRRYFKSERDVPQLNDEALMNCVSVRDLRELAQFELPQMSSPIQLGGKIGRDVDLSPGSLPRDPYAASLVAEALLFFALVYFSAFVREAVSSDSFPAKGTLFGAFSRTSGVLIVFYIAMWAPFLACCAVGLTSGKLLLGLAAVPVFIATFSAHQILAGKSFFEPIRPSALLPGYHWPFKKIKIVGPGGVPHSVSSEQPPTLPKSAED